MRLALTVTTHHYLFLWIRTKCRHLAAFDACVHTYLWSLPSLLGQWIPEALSPAVKGQKREYDPSPSSSAKVNTWSYTSIPLSPPPPHTHTHTHVFLAWYLIKLGTTLHFKLVYYDTDISPPTPSKYSVRMLLLWARRCWQLLCLGNLQEMWLLVYETRLQAGRSV
jgi:hypothetical protein